MACTKFMLMTVFAVGLTACSTVPHMASADEKTQKTLHSKGHHGHDQPRPYDALRDAKADVNAAMTAAKESGKMTIIAMGANWCHDSRGLAAQFQKDRFKTLLTEHYELVYVDVGMKNRNIEIAQKFGVDSIVGTPTVFVLNSAGKVLNLDTAPTWRNADSRTEDEVWDYFEAFTQNAKVASTSVPKSDE